MGLNLGLDLGLDFGLALYLELGLVCLDLLGLDLGLDLGFDLNVDLDMGLYGLYLDFVEARRDVDGFLAERRMIPTSNRKSGISGKGMAFTVCN